MAWGKPPYKTGKSNGWSCGYCYKFFTNRIKKIADGETTMTMTDYEHHLGKEEGRLQKHLALVDSLIRNIIEKGGSMSVCVDWEHVQCQANLYRQKKSSMVKSKPGFDWLPKSFYEARHQPLAVNGKRQTEGHYEHTLDGQEGVAMPHDPTVTVRFDDEVATLLSSKISSTDEALPIGELEFQKTALTNAVTTGDSSASVDMMLGLGVQTSAGQCAVETPAQQRQSRGCGLGAPQPKRGNSSLSHEKPSGRPGGLDVHTSASSETPGRSGNPSEHTEKTMPGTNVKRPSKNEAGATGDKSKQKRGRPRRDFVLEVDNIVKDFAKAEKDNSLWFGSESRVKAKCILALVNDMKARKKATQDAEEADEMQVLVSKLEIVKSLQQGVIDHGIDGGR